MEFSIRWPQPAKCQSYTSYTPHRTCPNIHNQSETSPSSIHHRIHHTSKLPKLQKSILDPSGPALREPLKHTWHTTLNLSQQLKLGSKVTSWRSLFQIHVILRFFAFLKRTGFIWNLVLQLVLGMLIGHVWNIFKTWKTSEKQNHQFLFWTKNVEIHFQNKWSKLELSPFPIV